MKIIITMAGQGSRFREIGIAKPKHEIIANGRTLFEWSMLSLLDFFDETFVFIVRKNYYNGDAMKFLCDNIGVNKFEIVELDELTDGQARTALMGRKYVAADESFAIFNIDTAIKPLEIKKTHMSDFDGFIPCFKADGDHWSFVKPAENEYGVATQVVEKIRISDLATVGFYYFKRFGDFSDLIAKHQDEIKRNYRELYVAPVFQYLIDAGRRVGYNVIDKNVITNLGTPIEVESFDNNYLEHNNTLRG